MPSASLPASGLAFHGIDQSPIWTSRTSRPSGSGSDHFQQNPAERRDVCPASAFIRTSCSSSWGESTTSKSNSSDGSSKTYGVCLNSSVLSTQPTKASDPPQRKYVSSSCSI